MKCRKARSLILCYAELDASQKKRLDEHLSSCPQCSSEFSTQIKSIDLLKKVVTFEGSESFWEGYRVNLQRSIPTLSFWSRVWTKVEGWTSLFKTPILGPVPIYAFSFALIVILTLGFYPGFLSSEKTTGFKNNLVVHEGELLSAVDDGGLTIYTWESK
jgi:hypothetical protein